MIRIISLTDSGYILAEKIQRALVGQLSVGFDSIALHHKPKPFTNNLQSMFANGDRMILICAMGIAVRTLAPVLKDKFSDPAVLVLDEEGRFVVPLLSGHEGGANHWASELAAVIDGQPIITTAKPYVKPIYTLGMGCERDCPISYLTELRDQCLYEVGLTVDDIQSVNSIALKSDEVGLIELANGMDCPFQTWTTEVLSEVEHLLSVKSDYVYQTVGVYGVAESAALIGAQRVTTEESELILVKQKNAKATCAIARSYPSSSQLLNSELEKSQNSYTS